MSNPSERTKKANGRLITQVMPRGRLRLNPDVLPELVTWIMVHGLRYERHRESILKLPHVKEDKYAKRSLEIMEYFLTCLQHLINQMNDTVGIAEWNKAWIEIDSSFGLGIGPLAYDHYAGTDEAADAGEKA